MKTSEDNNGGVDVGQNGCIRRRSRCGAATEEMCDDGDGETGWKNGNGMGKYLQGTSTNLREYHCFDNLGVGATTDLHVDLGCIWRLCVSYCNLKKLPADSSTNLGALIMSSFTLERINTSKKMLDPTLWQEKCSHV